MGEEEEDEDLGFESVSFPFDRYLTVLGLLKTHYGAEHGEEIYELLRRTATESSGGHIPGIVFDDGGGSFVGIEGV